MKLTKDDINKIRVNLEPGYVIELTVDKEGHVHLGKRPPEREVIEIPPALLSADKPTKLELRILNPSGDPIQLGIIDIGPNTWIRGILTCPGISQEMEKES